MKIVIDGRLWGLENAGLGRYTMKLVESLARVDTKNEYAVLLRKKYFKECQLPQNWIKVLAEARHYSVSEQIVIPRILRRLKPDLVHFLHFNVPFFVPSKFVVTIHDLLMHKRGGMENTTLPFFLYFPKRAGYKLVFDKALRGSSAIITPSNAVAEELSLWFKIPKEKISVIYEGVEIETSPKVRENEILDKYNIGSPYFIFVGNLYPHKNVERVIEATVSLKKALFVIVSSRGVFLDRIVKAVKRFSAGEYVRFASSVGDEELSILYKKTRAFVFPSFSEGFGLPGLEAMAAGTLCLASDIPVFREIYKDTPYYFNPYDFSSIEKAMADVLTQSPKERKERIKYGQEFVERYSWEKTARETLALYGEVLNQKRP